MLTSMVLRVYITNQNRLPLHLHDDTTNATSPHRTAHQSSVHRLNIKTQTELILTCHLLPLKKLIIQTQSSIPTSTQ